MSTSAGPDLSLITVKGLIGEFRQEIEVAPTWATDVGFLSESDQETETYRWLGQTPQFREWVNSRILKGLRVESYTITNKTYEATLEIAKTDWRRDKIGGIRLRIGDLAVRTAEHWEKLLSSLIEDNGTCYDGQNYFSASHSSGDSGTLSNLVTNSDVPALDVTTAAGPTVAEMVDVILGLIQHMMTFKDDQGEPINGGAREFVLMVPTNMYGAALGAVNDAFIGSGRSNTVRGAGFDVRVMVNPRLTSTTVCYLYRTDRRAKPFILQSEMMPEVTFIGPGSEQAFLHGRYLFGIETCRNVGYGLWQYGLKATLS